MFGPLFVLKYKGLLCPCLETTCERAARTALQLLSNLQIEWLRDSANGSASVTAAASNLVGKLFSSSSSSKSSGSSGSGGSIPSVLVWTDDGESGQPILQVQPHSGNASSTEGNNDIDDSNSGSGDGRQAGGLLQQSAMSYMKTLSLTDIRDVELVERGSKRPILVLTTRVGGKPKKLLQFKLAKLNDGISSSSVSPQDVQEAFRMLIAWDMERIPQEEREMEDNDSRNRAQKAAHFCQRELELQTMKREREKKKQKYLNMSRKNGAAGGGMKYTAIAMANRPDATIT